MWLHAVALRPIEPSGWFRGHCGRTVCTMPGRYFSPAGIIEHTSAVLANSRGLLLESSTVRSQKCVDRYGWCLRLTDRRGRNVHENHMIPGPGLKIATAKKLARSSPNCGLDTNHETITYVTQPTHRAPAVSRAPGAPQDDRNHATRSRKAQTGRPA
jgi:hypothetical protein